MRDEDRPIEIGDFVWVGDMTARVLGFEGTYAWVHGKSEHGEWDVVIERPVSTLEPVPGRPRYDLAEQEWD